MMDRATAHRAPRRPIISTTVAAVVALTGCAASAPHYYSLQSVQTAAEKAPASVGSQYAINVQPVIIPVQVARPQIVVRSAESAEVVPLSSALWAGPLEQQIRNALAEELALRLNVLDVGRSGGAEGLPVWEIYLDVQRFDSLYDHAVQQEAVWRLVPQGMSAKIKPRLCSAVVDIPVGTGMSALVKGHRQALGAIAATIAETMAGSAGAARKPAGTGSSVNAGSSANALQRPEGLSFRGCVTAS